MDQLKKCYLIQENKLIIDDTILEFDYAIDKCLEISGMIIVLLVYQPKIIYNENVFGVSIIERRVFWQIGKLAYKAGSNCPFIEMVFYEGKIRLINWCSIYLIVDPITGAILEESLPEKH